MFDNLLHTEVFDKVDLTLDVKVSYLNSNSYLTSNYWGWMLLTGIVVVAGTEYTTVASDDSSYDYMIVGEDLSLETDFNLKNFHWFTGTYKETNTDFSFQSNDERDKLPMVWLSFTPTPESTAQPDLSPISFIDKFSMFFCASADFREFTTENHMRTRVDLIDIYISAFLDAIKKSDCYQTVDGIDENKSYYPKFGDFGSGDATSIIDSQLSAIEVRFTLKENKNCINRVPLTECQKVKRIDFGQYKSCLTPTQLSNFYANVENSDLTYSVVVNDGMTLVLPNITNTDSDGTSVTVPAQTPFVCTPHSTVDLLTSSELNDPTTGLTSTQVTDILTGNTNINLYGRRQIQPYRPNSSNVDGDWYYNYLQGYYDDNTPVNGISRQIDLTLSNIQLRNILKSTTPNPWGGTSRFTSHKGSYYDGAASNYWRDYQGNEISIYDMIDSYTIPDNYTGNGERAGSIFELSYILDHYTDTIWTRGTLFDSMASGAWSDLYSYIALITSNGMFGNTLNWRFPTINELLEIYRYGHNYPLIIDNGFYRDSSSQINGAVSGNARYITTCMPDQDNLTTKFIAIGAVYANALPLTISKSYAGTTSQCSIMLCANINKDWLLNNGENL